MILIYAIFILIMIGLIILFKQFNKIERILSNERKSVRKHSKANKFCDTCKHYKTTCPDDFTYKDSPSCNDYEQND